MRLQDLALVCGYQVSDERIVENGEKHNCCVQLAESCTSGFAVCGIFKRLATNNLGLDQEYLASW